MELIEFLKFYMEKYFKSQKRKRYLRKYRRKGFVLAKSSASKIKGRKASFLIIDDPFCDKYQAEIEKWVNISVKGDDDDH